jgi:uncharacterized protein (DUF697 family)
MVRKSRVSLGDVADIVSSGRDTERRRTSEVAVLLSVDPTANREMAEALKVAFMPELGSSVVRVAGFDRVLLASRSWDAAVVLAGADALGAADMAEDCARHGAPVALVVESALDVRRPALPENVASLVEVIPATSAGSLTERLGRWIVDAAPDKSLALAANFSFCRSAKIDQLVNACAIENAAVGAIDIIPGADFPVMTVNQAKLAMDIAAAYGRPLSVDRLADLGGVLGAGFLYRYIARTLVGLVPGVGWALKGAMGFAGTFATGRALALRFDPDAPKPRAAFDRAGRVARQVARSATDIARAVRGDDCPDDGREGSASERQGSEAGQAPQLPATGGDHR